MRIAITGSSGLIGTALAGQLAAENMKVLPVVRRKVKATTNEISRDPETGTIAAADLDGLDAVINLAGENIFGRWTEQKKQRILQSRRRGTRTLCETLSSLKHPPATLISASAVGFYGDTGNHWVDETSASGGGFLAHVCREWEAATQPAQQAGIRTVLLRLGIVLSADGGALKMMLTPFRLGVGGPVGSGKQYLSWIHMHDLCRIVELVLTDTQWEGPLNAVAPHPVTNRELANCLGNVLHRPSSVPLPALATKFTYGQMAEELLLAGQRVKPTRLLEHGFQYQFPDVEQALRHELN